ncbi:DUF3231 family protein [Bacillus mesophilum]|uniref:DUF3231 family protein n=1 Tax=Bacillus mesophilum TaxID=1071718 RepID=A0A7V7RQP6_9BACI|nr:DUF3231 family protein [Bacillus mesophilum]KAB2335743.1 DUF3231 family protein [Bacillus mesophilum]
MKQPLMASEIGILWTSFQNDSMSCCILSHMLKYADDQEIKKIIESALEIACVHIEKLTHLFEKEKYAKPTGFTKKDVNLNAPRLFSDAFCVTYINHMAKAGMVGYSGMLAMSAREDIVDFYSKALLETRNLYETTLKVMIKNGLYVRAPYIPLPSETDYVDSSKYLSGLNPFSKKRPLNAIEISHLFLNIQTNSIGVKLCLAFGQTSPRTEVQEYMLRGKQISEKQMAVFIRTLLENNISAPTSPDECVTETTTQIFSDQLVMFHMALLSAAGTGNYATAAAASQRSDLAINYERLSFEIARYAKQGADIMIKNNWLEQPPGTIDREKLVRNKGEA